MQKGKIKVRRPKIRRTWDISPATKVRKSGKIYKRKKKHSKKEEE